MRYLLGHNVLDPVSTGKTVGERHDETTPADNPGEVRLVSVAV
jgi:hypothetical protein